MAKQTKSAETNTGIDWSSYDTTGFEQVDQSDLGIPYLEIVQKGSPEFDTDHPDHATKKLPNAQVGMIFNTLTREVLYDPSKDAPITVVPVTYDRVFNEWRPRESGGGFVGTHTDQAILAKCKKNEKGMDVLPNGNIIVNTAFVCVLIIHEGGEPEKAVISFRSTQLKKARMWLNLMMAQKIPGTSRPKPMFSQKYALSSTAEKNEKGSWRGWKIDHLGEVDNRDLIGMAVDAAKTLKMQTQAALPEIAADTDDDGPF